MSNQIQRTAADEILMQLGGPRRLKAAIGAKEFHSEDDGTSLTFKIGGGAKDGIKHITIHHNCSDTYDISFIKIKRKKDKSMNIFIPERVVISKHDGCYNDMLKPLIEKETGFYLNPFG